MRNKLIECGSCPFFRPGDDDLGYCDLSHINTLSDEECFVTTLNSEQAAKVLRHHQKWRRGADIRMTSGKLVGLAIDQAIKILRKDTK